jgi:hypothetical protein
MKATACVMSAIAGLLAAFAGYFMLGLACAPVSNNSKASAETAVPPRLAEPKTIGNHSYVPLSPRTSDNALELVTSFEVRHPELEITHWQVDPLGPGIFIDHRPRPEVQPVSVSPIDAYLKLFAPTAAAPLNQETIPNVDDLR